MSTDTRTTSTEHQATRLEFGRDQRVAAIRADVIEALFTDPTRGAAGKARAAYTSWANASHLDEALELAASKGESGQFTALTIKKDERIAERAHAKHVAWGVLVAAALVLAGITAASPDTAVRVIGAVIPRTRQQFGLVLILWAGLSVYGRDRTVAPRATSAMPDETNEVRDVGAIHRAIHARVTESKNPNEFRVHEGMAAPDGNGVSWLVESTGFTVDHVARKRASIAAELKWTADTMEVAPWQQPNGTLGHPGQFVITKLDTPRAVVAATAVAPPHPVLDRVILTNGTSIYEGAPIGWWPDETGTAHIIRAYLWNMMFHTAGESQSGKTNSGLDVLAWALLDPYCRVMVVDPKADDASAEYQSLGQVSNTLIVGSRAAAADAIVAMFAELAAVFNLRTRYWAQATAEIAEEERGADLGKYDQSIIGSRFLPRLARHPKWGRVYHPVIVFLDEAQVLQSFPPEVWALIKQALEELAQRYLGRGIHLWSTTQSMKDDLFPKAALVAMGGRNVHRLNDHSALTALLGQRRGDLIIPPGQLDVNEGQITVPEGGSPYGSPGGFARYRTFLFDDATEVAMVADAALALRSQRIPLIGGNGQVIPSSVDPARLGGTGDLDIVPVHPDSIAAAEAPAVVDDDPVLVLVPDEPAEPTFLDDLWVSIEGYLVEFQSANGRALAKVSYQKAHELMTIAGVEEIGTVADLAVTIRGEGLDRVSRTATPDDGGRYGFAVDQLQHLRPESQTA